MDLPPGLTKSRLIIIGIGGALVIGIVGLFFWGSDSAPAAPSIKLTVWGTFNNRLAFQNMIKEYKTARSNVTVTYKELESQTYESELMNDLAAGNGPDVFMFHNTWLPKHIDKITPVASSQLPYIKFEDLFKTDAIMQDFAPQKTIYASPLYLDTLAMFYNKDMFDKNGIAENPRTWTDFQNAVKKMREIDPATNEIKKAGAAIGGSEKSVNRASDLLGLLMLQSGAQMTTNDFSNAVFTQQVRGQDQSSKNPGLDSLNFYTQFSNPASPYYTWNEDSHYSIDNFGEGTTGIIFNYAHQIPVIRSKNPFLNFGIAEVPQLADSDQPVAYPNYWGLAVSNKSKNAPWAWDFIIFATTNSNAAKIYSDNTKLPPALRTLVSQNFNDIDLHVFAKQALIARSWPQIDNVRVTEIFSNMIQEVITRKLSATEALRKAEDEVSLLMRTKNSSN